MSLMTFVTMTPLGKGESVSKYVAQVVDVVDRSGLPYVITPMGTIIETETWEEVMSVLEKGFNQLQQECARISIVIKIDYRKDKPARLNKKIDSLEKKLHRELHKID
jgi:uncharacterized protein (TIGR00106 family)